MIQERTAQPPNAGISPEIESLLTFSDSASMVDRLLSLPLTPDADETQWNRAVNRRLENRLAETMRTLLTRPESRDAA